MFDRSKYSISLSLMSADVCTVNVAKIEIKNEKRIGVGCIFFSFFAVWVHSNLYPRISSSSSRAKIQRIIETGLVQISPNRWSN